MTEVEPAEPEGGAGKPQPHLAQALEEAGRREFESLREEIVDEVLDGVVVDDETKSEIGRRIEMVVGAVQTPIPPPFMMRDYAKVLPTAPERILSMAETQATHRQALERGVVLGGNRRAYIGQILGFVVALLFGYGSYDLIMEGHATAGTLLGIVDLTALVSVFVLGRERQRSARDDNRQP